MATYQAIYERAIEFAREDINRFDQITPNSICVRGIRSIYPTIAKSKELILCKIHVLTLEVAPEADNYYSNTVSFVKTPIDVEYIMQIETENGLMLQKQGNGTLQGLLPAHYMLQRGNIYVRNNIDKIILNYLPRIEHISMHTQIPSVPRLEDYLFYYILIEIYRQTNGLDTLDADFAREELAKALSALQEYMDMAMDTPSAPNNNRRYGFDITFDNLGV